MKIKQLYSAFGAHFRNPFLKKYNMVPYRKKDEPVVMFGCYGNQIDVAFNNKSKVKIIWAGSDCSNFIKNPEWVAKMKSRTDIEHIAISNFIVDDLTGVGIPCVHIPIVPHDNNDIKPHPMGDSIYMYKPSAYGPSICRRIKKELPQFNYIDTWLHSYSRTELIEKYKESFIGVRIIGHDGLSNTAIELGLMGRKIIWNGCSPNAIPHKDIEGIKNTILKEYHNRKSDEYLKTAKDVSDYINIGDDFLNY